MKLANLSLVIAACILSAFGGGFVGGFAGAVLGAAAGGIVSLLGCLGAAHLVGSWIGRRKDAPSEQELLVGCWAYVLVSVVLAGLSRHPIGIIFALVGGGGVAYLLHRGAIKAIRNLSGSAARSTRGLA